MSPSSCITKCMTKCSLAFSRFVCMLRFHLVISLLVSFVSSPCFICLFTFHLCEVCALVSVSVFMLPVLFWRSLVWCGLFPVLLPSSYYFDSPLLCVVLQLSPLLLLVYIFSQSLFVRASGHYAFVFPASSL